MVVDPGMFTALASGLSDYRSNTMVWAQQAVEERSPGATVVPLLVSTDKTQLTLFRNKSAYPVYLTIGNIPKEIRRKPSARAYILLGYLPTTRLENVTNKAARRRMLGNLYHSCMGEILKPLQDCGENGVFIATADGQQRRMHLILAAFIGDYPEQVLTACVYSGDCPTCSASRGKPGYSDNPQSSSSQLRDLDHILSVLDSFETYASGFLQSCKSSRIKPVASPFWRNLPYLNIYQSITPDVLHQLYQGLIKHLVGWLINVFGPLEIDARCRRLPLNHNIRAFAKGISSLNQISGKEHDQIAQILIGLIVDLQLPNKISPLRLVRSVRALLDFLYLAQYPVHTDDTLKLLESALKRFHDNKSIFVDLGIRTNFDLPKLHFAAHYVSKIKLFGTTDNFNTEYTERLHIDLAKDAYRATNHKDEFLQMTIWLERWEKVQRHEQFLEWCLNGKPPAPSCDWITPGLGINRSIHLSQRPSARKIHINNIIEKHGATYFREALSRFAVLTRHPALSSMQLERAIWGVQIPQRNFWVWHHLKFLSTDQFTGTTSTADSIHANPGLGRFDTALIRVGKDTKGIRGECLATCTIVSPFQRVHL